MLSQTKMLLLIKIYHYQSFSKRLGTKRFDSLPLCTLDSLYTDQMQQPTLNPCNTLIHFYGGFYICTHKFKVSEHVPVHSQLIYCSYMSLSERKG